MTEKVLAALAVKPRVTELREFDMPETAADSGILKVEATGVCGSDWPYYMNLPQSRGPLILGHETVGRIDRVGAAAAKRWGVKEGDRVAMEEYIPCGHCEYCRTGDFRLCNDTDIFLGGLRYGSTSIRREPGLWGGYSEYKYLHPNAVFHKLPDHVPVEQAAMALPLGNGIEWAVLQGKAGIGKTVVIQGPGQQGLACVIAAKEAGASLIIVSGTRRSSARLALAREFGADHTVVVDDQDLVDEVAKLTNGRMADLVIDCASGGTDTILSALQVAGKRGIVLLGGEKRKTIPDFDMDILIRKFLTVKGMRGHSFEAVEMAIQIIASGKYPLEKMSTHQFGLDEVDDALRTLAGEHLPGAIHITVFPWERQLGGKRG